MKFMIFIALGLFTSKSSALFWKRSNCNSDRQCPTIRRRECPTLICIPFIGIGRYKDTTISEGRCNNYDNGPLCNLFGGKFSSLFSSFTYQWYLGGGSCKVRRCVECYRSSDCTLTVGRGDVSNNRIMIPSRT